jgi:DNA-binding CsgD family transcriptional regulator/RimJ/RimL family protein N-acetyltransferase
MAASRSTIIWQQGGVVVRPPSLEDAQGLAAACQDEHVVRWNNIPLPYTRTHAEQWVVDHGWDDTERWWSRPTWSVLDDGRWLGSIGFRPRPFGAANLALLIGSRSPQHFPFALRTASQWAFDTLGIDVIRWVGLVGDESGIHAVRTAGFEVHADVHRMGFIQRGIRRDAISADLVRGDNIGPTGSRSRFTGPALTAREEQVLNHMATGQSNRGIANSLGISENTVKNHVRGILEKLQAASRVEAVVIGAQLGLVHVGPHSPHPGNR